MTLLTVLAADSSYGSPAAVGVGLILGGVIGGLIGSRKNRTGLGVLLGAFLGCIGWIIIALIPRKSPY